ncbi:2-isopropylmalate synthase [Alcanivorax marinus]|uniref:2-isopropylmalate synthase n=1 Tax=Alloalcanivorax marinus TaxID=1177169 RepID=A0A9Q3US88_9GAMM|nr:2-isopropylmalate synthase [Alloalcanivorax marinus]MCC4310629.1 2-isopropylmalate synthase [Alloalcanivorax marinus]MCU5788464.1 2-isopropylmalate synthase [Alloalcanivorax marinus]
MSFDHRKYAPFPTIDKPDRQWPSKRIEKAPLWAAVDLRDGNQALIKPMSVAQKKRFFKLLVELGYKEIEVGFPSASQIDYDFCRALIEEDLVPDDVHIQVLSQARQELIERTFESLKGAKKAVVHIYNATSPTFREQVFNVDKEGCKAIAVKSAEWVRDAAAKQPDTEWSFQYSPETFSATETDFAIEVIDAVNEVWRPDQGQRVIINLPATVEVSTPNVFADQVELVHENIRYREHVLISVHTHDDRGCGVAAAELAVMAGADRVEGTLLGNGERTGNMDLVTAGMNLYAQGIDPEIDFSRMKEIRALVEEITEIDTHPRHPYAGDLVFTAFSGSHQDAIRKCLARYTPGDIWRVAYLPIDPHDLGRRYEEVVRINSQSGKGGVAHVLERDFGISLPRWLQQELAMVVQQDAEEDGGEITGERIHRRFNGDYLNVPAGWTLRSYDLHRADDGVRARISVGDEEGATVDVEGRGEGAMGALVDALNRRHGWQIRVEAFDEYSLGDNTEANAMACVRVQVGEQVQSAVALAADTTAAALQAILSAAGRVAASEAEQPARARA